MTNCLTWTLYDEATGLKVNVTAEEDQAGKVVFKIQVDEGLADLNGFFLDLEGDGGNVYFVGSNANNMNGSNNNGETIKGFDKAWHLSDEGIGKNKQDVQVTTVEWEGSLDDLTDAIVGIRATSVATVGEDGELVRDENGKLVREESLKLTAICDKNPEPPTADHFPVWPQDISNVVLYFDAPEGSDEASGDMKPKPDGDGYYTVKIDNWPGAADDDLDKSIDAILAHLIEKDPFVNADSNLLGAAIKGGTQTTQFYAYGDNNANGTDPDPVPPGAPVFSTPPEQGNVDGSSIDASYDYGLIFA